jgi:purine-binding chemotaxis protein CheW
VDLAKIRKKAKVASGESQPARDDHPGQAPAGRDPASDDPPTAQNPAEPVAPLIPEVEPGVPPPNPAASDPATSPHDEAENQPGPLAESAPLPGEKLLVFDLANEKYAIPIHDIAQIIDLPVTTPVPNAPPFLAGIFSLRGRIVSIIDVARRLRVERPETEALKVIVLDVAQDHFGLLVDRIDQVVDVNLAGLEPPPEGFKPMAQDFVEGVFHLKGRAVGFLNLPMFLDFEV